MESINHNLPSINTKIYYEFVPPLLKIKNVTALTKISSRYWISFRARYATGDGLNLIGSVSINLRDELTKVLFISPVVNVPRVPIPYADYHDWAGFHSSFRNFDTQIISSTDNLLENGTF